MSKVLLIALFSVIFMHSCYYDVQEELYPCSAGTSPTYSLNVEPVISLNCYSCHGKTTSSSGGGIILEGYENLILKVNDNRLWCAINHESGCSPMPQGSGKLGTCALSDIDQWIKNGALNN